jgi:hypothetical protein
LVRRIFDPLILLCYGYRPTILWLDTEKCIMSRQRAIEKVEKENFKFKDVI